MPEKRCFVLMMLLVVTLTLGCSDSGVVRKKVDSSNNGSLVEYFREVHANTETPNGRVRMETAVETETGTIEYETDDGSKFRITGTVDRELGGVRWETPTKID